MTEHLVTYQRILAGAAGVAALLIGGAGLAAGLAFSGVWPGIAWGLGSAIALVAIVGGAALLRMALTGRRPHATESGSHRGAT